MVGSGLAQKLQAGSHQNTLVDLMKHETHIEALKNAFKKGKLTLYLGAGVSMASGLPAWEELVHSLYFKTIKDDSVDYSLRPFPNYLFALAEWVLKQKSEPLEIIVRKLKNWYESGQFIEMISDTLYAGFSRRDYPLTDDLSGYLLEQNQTLRSIIDCCKKSVPGKKGVGSIVSYNYDNLVELCLGEHAENFETVYRGNTRLTSGKIPIYHVHGYIPYQKNDVAFDDLVFSEDQYNRVFQDPYYWGNVVQINQLTTNTGLMLGISLSDRNTRRILDSILNQPLPKDNYIIMKKPVFRELTDDDPDLQQIRNRAEYYLKKFPGGRLKMPAKEPYEIKRILSSIYSYEMEEFSSGFEKLGLKLILIDSFDEIPEILESIRE